MRKSVVALSVAVAFLFLATFASANVTNLSAGESGVCENASWVVYNQDEVRDTTVVFNVGPIGYGWGKDVSRSIAPGGYQANAMAKKTTFTNKGPGVVTVNCQRQRFDRHDWKIDAGSGKTYQSDYHMDHVTPGTYIEPGYGMPEGTERGIFSVGGQASERNR